MPARRRGQINTALPPTMTTSTTKQYLFKMRDVWRDHVEVDFNVNTQHAMPRSYSSFFILPINVIFSVVSCLRLPDTEQTSTTARYIYLAEIMCAQTLLTFDSDSTHSLLFLKNVCVPLTNIWILFLREERLQHQRSQDWILKPFWRSKCGEKNEKLCNQGKQILGPTTSRGRISATSMFIQPMVAGMCFAYDSFHSKYDVSGTKHEKKYFLFLIWSRLWIYFSTQHSLFLFFDFFKMRNSVDREHK